MDEKKIVEETIEKYAKYINPGLARYYKFAQLDTVEWTSAGSKVWDVFGNEYIDCLGGFGVFNVGRNHPRVVQAVKEQLERLPLSTRTLFNKHQADLAEMLARITPGNLQYSFFGNSGTEAVEGALKLARFIPAVKTNFCRNSFHGKTMGSLSLSGREVYKKPFLPCLPEVYHVPFNDIDALKQLVDKETAAVILEPVQGEGGIIIPSPDYLKQVKSICEKQGALLILDEIQTGLGRTGKMFACEHFDVVPDIMTLAKGLGGGVLPIGAFISTAEIWKVFEENPFIHSSTLGGNPLSCVAGIETLKILQDENIPELTRIKGEKVLQRLGEIQAESEGMIQEIRGIGLLIGIQFGDSDIASLIAMEMAQRRVLVAYTLNNPTVIRIEPPLTISYEELETVLSRLNESLVSVRVLLNEIEGE